MCLMVFAHKVHPKYPLIFASNRDEFYKRPAMEATFWPEHPDLLAGKDLEAGGTWMGVTKNGRFAALTNYRNIEEIKENAPSRGDLVKDFLTSEINAENYLSTLGDTAREYNGFNLIVGNAEELWYINNKEVKAERVKPGYHSLSNAFLDTKWPKTEQALRDFKKSVQPDDTPNPEKLFSLLNNDQRYPRHMLPETGLSDEMEQVVSSVFIKSEEYGTRCSTVYIAAENEENRFFERTFRPNGGGVRSEVSYSF
ncbi:MAG: NRDE family protein [Balneolaceae bacterium]|nr:NRDE family protein [Balneolaceae bacterium]